MIYDYHVVLGALGAGLGLLGYALYFRSIFAGITKPHVFTWLTYFLLDIIVFVAQVIKGGGAGTWVTLSGAVGTFCVTVVALRLGEKHIRKSDWISFGAALFAIALWLLTDTPLVAVVIAAIINFLAMAPTFRKSYVNPFQESTSIWILDIIRFSLGIIALGSINATTVLFPAALVLGNAMLVAMILVRRSQLRVYAQ